jgi:amino acid adenylation domain-containing protein
VCVDDDTVLKQLSQQPINNLHAEQPGLTSSHLAYVIYTSGSTGNPKGVMVEHNNVVNFLATMREKPGIAAEDCLLAVTSTSFDIHGLELFLPLTVGAKLVVASKRATSHPEMLVALMTQHQVSLMQATPATWKMLLEIHWSQKLALKILCGGEALSVAVAKALLSQPAISLWNMYGPTETTIWSTTQQVLREDDQVLMGHPIGNTQVYVVRDTSILVPVGVAGELLIGGAGVTRGYLNRPELTAEKFIANPFYDKSNPTSSKRLYKTGDLVRWLPNGNLEFLGRIDHQVKIRGFRIELGEIEHKLSTHVDVKDVVVLARESRTSLGDKHLVAYVVTSAVVDLQDNTDIAVATRCELIENLRQHLSQSLPDYMVPSAFVLLEKIPLTPNGKVDRKALPDSDFSQLQRIYVAPRTEMEKTLCHIWQEVLGVEPVGLSDNFFQLGGNSLLAVSLTSRIRKILGVEIAVRVLFISPTVKGLLASMRNKIPTSPFPNLVPIRTKPVYHAKLSDEVSPLFFIHPSEGEIGYVSALAPWLDKNLAVYGIAAMGFLEGEKVLRSVPEMASYYIQAIRHIRKSGPYRVAGWSAGGNIAYEMARQLLTMGETIEFLGLIDTASNIRAGRNIPRLLSSGNSDVDDAAMFVAALPLYTPEALVLEVSALAKIGDVAAILERCRGLGIYPDDVDTTTLRRHLAVRAGITKALLEYVPKPLPVRLSLFVATQESRSDTTLGWSALMGDRLTVVPINGTHFTIVEEPNVRDLASAISKALLTQIEKSREPEY